MKKLNYTDEATFLTEDVEFSDEHFSLAESLHEQYKSALGNVTNSELSLKCSPIMVRKGKGTDKPSLLFCVNLGDRMKDRVAYERGDNLYRIVIEKI